MSTMKGTKEILRRLCDEQWSNDACCGYIILACENLGYPEDQIRVLLNSTDDMFDIKTIEQAKRKFYDY